MKEPIPNVVRHPLLPQLHIAYALPLGHKTDCKNLEKIEPVVLEKSTAQCARNEF